MSALASIRRTNLYDLDALIAEENAAKWGAASSGPNYEQGANGGAGGDFGATGGEWGQSRAQDGKSEIWHSIEKFRKMAEEDMKRLRQVRHSPAAAVRGSPTRSKPPPPPGRPSRSEKRKLSPTRVQNALLESEGRAVEYRQEIAALKRDNEMLKTRISQIMEEKTAMRKSMKDLERTNAHLRRTRDKIKGELRVEKRNNGGRPQAGSIQEQLATATEKITKQRGKER